MEKNSKVIKYINIIKTEFNYIDDYNKLRETNDYIIFLKLNPM